MDTGEYLSKAFSLSHPAGPQPLDTDLDLYDDEDDDFIDFDDEDLDESAPPIGEMLKAMFLGFELHAFAKQLATLKDGLPLPEVFEWQPEVLVEKRLDLASEDLRTLKAFREIVRQDRKSGKYFQAMQTVSDKYPDCQEMVLGLLTYLDQWDPAEAQRRSQELLQAHPEWLLLRCARASQVIMQAPPDELPDEAPVIFDEMFNHQLELHQHLKGEVPSDELVFTFYHATAAYFIVTGRFERALYSLNVCAKVQPNDLLEPLLFHLLMQMEQSGKSQAIRTFLNPLLEQRLADLRKSS